MKEKEVRGGPCDIWAGSELIEMCLGGFCCVLVSQHVTKVDRFKEITGYFCLQVTEEETTGAEEAAVKEKEVRGGPCDIWAGSELI